MWIGLRGVMRVCNASKVTKRIIWTRRGLLNVSRTMGASDERDAVTRARRTRSRGSLVSSLALDTIVISGVDKICVRDHGES
jgi:hypothetical protein